MGDFVTTIGVIHEPGTPAEQRDAIIRVARRFPLTSQRAERRHVLEVLGLLDRIPDLFDVQNIE
ncbi:MAG TPA: hypothetical protein VHX38_02835 [Pseudonocardiaceae bacterium]|nr:hypothetical protein [Pseudonocardiaceae bacterium]